MKTIITLLVWAVLMAFVCFVWNGASKQKEKKEKNLAVEKAKGVVAEIALRCSANTSKMILAVEDARDICNEGLMDASLPYSSSIEYSDSADAFMIAFDSRDYLMFAHLSALHYAKRFAEDDPERIAIEEYCKPCIGRLEKRHRSGEYRDYIYK